MISTNRILHYPMSLILSNAHHKSPEALSKLFSISGDTMLRILKNECVNWEELTDLAIKQFNTQEVELIIDDSIINKMHSEFIGGSSDNYDPVSKRVTRSLCTVVAMVTNGEIALPIMHKLWVNREVCSPDDYQSKGQIAKDIIGNLIGKIRIKIVLMDGLYASEDMIKWLNEKGIPFEIRFHSNRMIALDQSNPKATVKIRECKELKLKGKKGCKTIKGYWKGQLGYFTAVKRYEKDGSKRIVYQISNVKTFARNHVKFYDRRWAIERFFRTGKQSLGLAECQSREKIAQENHIYNVFFAYAILQFERVKNKFKTPEKALHAIKLKKNITIDDHLNRARQIFDNIESTYA